MHFHLLFCFLSQSSASVFSPSLPDLAPSPVVGVAQSNLTGTAPHPLGYLLPALVSAFYHRPFFFSLSTLPPSDCLSRLSSSILVLIDLRFRFLHLCDSGNPHPCCPTLDPFSLYLPSGPAPLIWTNGLASSSACFSDNSVTAVFAASHLI